MLDVGQQLESTPAKPMRFIDNFALWSSLGVTLTIPAAALYILQPLGTNDFSLTAAITALIAGLLFGSLALAGVAKIGADTGAPTMVLMRGLFGGKGSWAPTILNIAQCVGWAAVEILVIAHATERLLGGPLSLWLIVSGAIATLTSIRPLKFIRIIRKYVLWAVLLSTIYLFIAVLNKGFTLTTGSSWQGFWLALDVAIALPISWAPLVADYSRHAKSGSFKGTFYGYFLGAGTFFLLGICALLTFVSIDNSDVYGFSQAILLLPFGALALIILIVDEVDEAFANVYSTVASIQNIRPNLSRFKLSIAVGFVATILSLTIDVVGYESFLFTIGALFVPLTAITLVDWILNRQHWNLSIDAPMRWAPFISWVLGYIVYKYLHPEWLGASISSFLVSGLLTAAFSWRRI